MIQRLRKVIFISVLLSLLPAPHALAENSLKATAMALSFRVAEERLAVGGRYFMEPDLALLGELGLEIVDVEDGADGSGTSFRLGAGIRKYLSTQSEFAPFIGAALTFLSEFDPEVDDTTSGIGLVAHFGVEYFLGKRFSTEASAGVQFQTLSNGVDTTSLGTFSSAVGVNFYFP